MKKFICFFLFSYLFFSLGVNSDETSPVKQNFEEIFNVGKMNSHDDKFTLYFKTREKAVLAKGEEFNYINDYPQDLYILHNDTGNVNPLITYDWFPSKAKELNLNFGLPVFPEDYAYYLLNDNQTIIMISAVKSIDSNFKYNITTNTIEALTKNNRYNFMISSILKDCEFKNMNSLYECQYYKPLISSNLIN